MKTRYVLLAAGIAGVLGLLASLSADRRGDTRSPEAQAELKRAPGTAPVPVASEGEALPALSLADVQGVRRDLHAMVGGRPALINFWASWCGPCVEEMPLLDRFARAQAPGGVRVIGIALDEPAAVTAFLRRTPVGYPILIDTPGRADAGVRLGNPRGVLPYSLLVGSDGRILRQWVGPLDADDLDDWARDAGQPTKR